MNCRSDSPVGPVDPVAPVGPVTPVAPAVPAGPVSPVAPVGPVTPVAPVGPVTPVTPVAPRGMTKSNTAAWSEPLLVIWAAVPGSLVETVPT